MQNHPQKTSSLRHCIKENNSKESHGQPRCSPAPRTSPPSWWKMLSGPVAASFCAAGSSSSSPEDREDCLSVLQILLSGAFKSSVSVLHIFLGFHSLTFSKSWGVADSSVCPLSTHCRVRLTYWPSPKSSSQPHTCSLVHWPNGTLMSLEKIHSYSSLLPLSLSSIV